MGNSIQIEDGITWCIPWYTCQLDVYSSLSDFRLPTQKTNFATKKYLHSKMFMDTYLKMGQLWWKEERRREQTRAQIGRLQLSLSSSFLCKGKGDIGMNIGRRWGLVVRIKLRTNVLSQQTMNGIQDYIAHLK